ncbi:MAG: NAD(P)H-binding protein [Bryobacteraceae bacterium]
MQKVAIFGAAGAIGKALGVELERREIPFRAVGRTHGRLHQAFGTLRMAELTSANLEDESDAREACRAVDTVLYCVGVPYDRFELHPKLMQITVDAAIAERVERLAVVSSVYSYGVPQTQRVAETHSRAPSSKKGKLRKEQEDIALNAGKRGQLQSMVVRLPDFYGPHADQSLANPIFRAALAGKTANWAGPAGAPHEFVFAPDAGRVIADLAGRNDCYGEAWNFAGPEPISGVGFIQKVYQAVGREPKFRTAGRTMLRLLGLFNPVMRELPEMLYLQETPVLLDDSKLLRKLGGVRKTSYDDGIRQTLEWMRKGDPAPYFGANQ